MEIQIPPQCSGWCNVRGCFRNLNNWQEWRVFCINYGCDLANCEAFNGGKEAYEKVCECGRV